MSSSRRLSYGTLHTYKKISLLGATQITPSSWDQDNISTDVSVSLPPGSSYNLFCTHYRPSTQILFVGVRLSGQSETANGGMKSEDET
jgi:hypothetical protein